MLVGIVGKPSCGKSTFFKATTLADVEIANYPFTTIKPNHAVGYVKIDCVDTFFKKQCHPRDGFCLDHKRFIPVQLIDVAGLVPGAHEGLGMGNQFLDDLRQADVLIHVIDISGSVNEKGEPVTPLSYDPLNDVKFLEVELDYWYLGIIKKGWERFARQVMQEHQDIVKALTKQLTGLKVTEDMLKDTLPKLKLDPEKPTSWSDDDLLKLATALRKLTKPMVIAANKIDVPGAEKNFERIKTAFPDYIIVPCSAESELALKLASKHGLIKYIPGESTYQVLQEDKLNDKQKNAFKFVEENILKKHGSTGVQVALNRAVFDMLKYIAIYPGGLSKLEDSKGNCLPDCFLMPPKTTALDFAYRLHTDFGKNFIQAVNVKTRLPVGRDHQLEHTDVIEIKSGK